MPKVTERARIAKAADALWAEIGTFGAVGDWHPGIERVEAGRDEPGALRTAHLRGGGISIERLTDIDPNGRVYRYAMVETPLPQRGYVGEFRTEDNADGTSTVSWSGTFEDMSGDEATVVGAVRDFLRVGLAGIAARHGAAPAPRLVGINHVALEVGDLEAALAFYRSIFDVELRGRAPGMAFIDMGDQFLALSERGRAEPDVQRHFGLVVDDRTGLRERALAAGATLAEGPGLELRDPWGNRLEIVEYRNIQFTKLPGVLEALNVSPEKTAKATEELRAKGIVPP